MRKKVIKKKIYEISPCLHCGEDKIEYQKSTEPWTDEHWICLNCDSTYAFFDKEIAVCNEDIFHK